MEQPVQPGVEEFGLKLGLLKESRDLVTRSIFSYDDHPFRCMTLSMNAQLHLHLCSLLLSLPTENRLFFCGWVYSTRASVTSKSFA